MAAVSLSFPDLILLSVTVTSAIVAVRLLWNLASRKYKRVYGRPVRYVFIVGTAVGVALPWSETAGLVGAFFSSLILLVLASVYSILGWRAGGKALAMAWIPRERMRDWFLYLSVWAGVVGVVTTLISLAVNALYGQSLSSYVPLAFDTISILSALLEFTVYIPSYNHILALVYTFFVHAKRAASDTADPYVDDLDFRRIAEGSHYTDFEVRDALESLMRRRFATKISPVPAARVVFRINSFGMRYLRSVWEEVFYSMEMEKSALETKMRYLRDKLRYQPEADRELERRVRTELAGFRRNIEGLGDYGLLLGETKKSDMYERVAEIERMLSPRPQKKEKREPDAEEAEGV